MYSTMKNVPGEVRQTVQLLYRQSNGKRIERIAQLRLPRKNDNVQHQRVEYELNGPQNGQTVERDHASDADGSICGPFMLDWRWVRGP